MKTYEFKGWIVEAFKGRYLSHCGGLTDDIIEARVFETADEGYNEWSDGWVLKVVETVTVMHE